MSFCKIVVTNSLQKFPYNSDSDGLSYEIPDNLKNRLQVGSFVTVPFRKHKENGLVIDIFSELSQKEEELRKKSKIREIEDLIGEDSIYSKELIELIKFTASYYCCSYTEALNAALPRGLVKKPEKRIKLTIDENILGKEIYKKIIEDNVVLQILVKARNKTAKFNRLRVLTNLGSDELKKEIKKLEAKKYIVTEYLLTKQKDKSNAANPIDRLRSLDPGLIPKLTIEQERALSVINHDMANGDDRFHKFLVHGVTGSGKTEIYLRLIQSAFERNSSTIFLVPEISMAPQVIERIAQRFGRENVLIWHSALTANEREYTWMELLKKTPKVVVGARSAIFAPVHNLGLIVMDEEHENSYKQDSPAPRYHARVLAEKRSELSACPLIFGSATPSIELYYRTQCKHPAKIRLVELKKRVFDNPLPQVKIIDMREEFLSGNKTIFSKFLKNKIQEALEKREQVILFLNKRGSASHVFCRTCGYIYTCAHCDSKTIYHSDQKLMICHHCGYKEEHPHTCPRCEMNTIKFFGLGTQKLEEETAKAFPGAKVARMDSDVSRVKHSYIDVWNNFRDGEIDILIGTQMIAKGLDIHNLSTVGVIAADVNFVQLDYLSEERGFQLLTQVAGRAGRKDIEGSVVFQTYQPEKEAILHAQEQNYLKFYEKEIKDREAVHYPPFSTSIRFICASENQILAIETINKFHELIFELPIFSGTCQVLGPSPCMLSRINRKHRYHLLVKIPKLSCDNAGNALLDSFHALRLQELKKIFLHFKPERSVVFNIDVDNISLY